MLKSGGPSALLLAIGVVSAVSAQSARPTFDVASVKRTASDVGSSSQNIQPGVFLATNRTVAGLIQFAFNLRDYELTGGPDWIRRDGFDVTATSLGAANAEIRAMMRGLLEDRFKLTSHREKRDVPGSAVVLARRDGRLGPGVRSIQTCDEEKPFEPGDAPAGAIRSNGCSDMSWVASTASRRLGVPVVDKTGVKGLFDFHLYYSSEGVRDLPVSPTIDPNIPSFTSALQEQFGMKLERARVPVDVLIIDSVKQPTEN